MTLFGSSGKGRQVRDRPTPPLPCSACVLHPDEDPLGIGTVAQQVGVVEAIEGRLVQDQVLLVEGVFPYRLGKEAEAVHVGVVLNTVRRVNKSLSYVTTGQDVPDDIEPGGGRRLAQLILGSTKP